MVGNPSDMNSPRPTAVVTNDDELFQDFAENGDDFFDWAAFSAVDDARVDFQADRQSCAQENLQYSQPVPPDPLFQDLVPLDFHSSSTYPVENALRPILDMSNVPQVQPSDIPIGFDAQLDPLPSAPMLSVEKDPLFPPTTEPAHINTPPSEDIPDRQQVLSALESVIRFFREPNGFTISATDFAMLHRLIELVRGVVKRLRSSCGSENHSQGPRSRRKEIWSMATPLLEAHFASNPYIAAKDLNTLSGATGLSERQIKTWFSNARSRKDTIEGQCPQSQPARYPSCVDIVALNHKCVD